MPLRPRFLAPREIANVHGFPPSFEFPPLPRKKQYELIGNSLSVQVVTELLLFLFAPPPRLDEEDLCDHEQQTSTIDKCTP